MDATAIRSEDGSVKAPEFDAWVVMLPPCKICGGKASGCHYGANTCEPCKVSKYCLNFYNV